MFLNENIDSASLKFSWHYAKSQLKLKYRYTFLGFLWNFIEPALYLIILSLVFSVVNRMNINDYAVFLFSALVPWRYFEKVVNTVMESIAGGEWLLKKMYVSPFAFPLNKWFVSSIEFLFSIATAFVLFAVLKENWSIHLIIIPLAILMLIFFTSPILFSSNIFTEGSMQAQLMSYHPITYFAALFQKPVYQLAWPSITDWVISLSLSTSSLIAGIYLINKNKTKFYYYL